MRFAWVTFGWRMDDQGWAFIFYFFICASCKPPHPPSKMNPWSPFLINGNNVMIYCNQNVCLLKNKIFWGVQIICMGKISIERIQIWIPPHVACSCYAMVMRNKQFLGRRLLQGTHGEGYLTFSGELEEGCLIGFWCLRCAPAQGKKIMLAEKLRADLKTACPWALMRCATLYCCPVGWPIM